MISIAKPWITQDEKDAVLKVMDSGMIASGAVVSEFEQAFAGYVGARHGIATTSGTTALEVALRAMGVGPGDKVITTAYSFIASTNSILYAGARPVFVDIDPDTFNIDMDGLRAALKANPDAKALLVVHLFGQACNMDAVMALAGEHGVMVLEDCAQAHGAKWKGKQVGTFGDAAAYSFYPTKNMTTGEGGIVLTNRDDLADRARLLINHGMKIRYTHDILGYNYRMTNIAAAIGLEQLKRLDAFNAARRKNAAYYNAHIKNPAVQVPAVQPEAEHVYHQYTIRVKAGRRDALVKLFEAEGVGYGIFYPFSIPEQPCYKALGFETAWPATDTVKLEVLSIPVHPALTEAEVAAVATVIGKL
ncbi:MAG: DegT/DnrJ/EryC1/StrS family aminotransferase [Ruminococcaceae bacterium]|nr:DegT/DnrJ/EryC1/StrS family aminotransferase [Oscillospiraceae bacterium]